MGDRPHRDDVFVVERPFETDMRLYWRNPSVETRRVTLPVGLELVVITEPTLIARAAGLQPTDINRWEPSFIGEAERGKDMYGGYAFEIPFTDLRSNCARVDR